MKSTTTSQHVSVTVNVLKGNSNNVGKEINITDMLALIVTMKWKALLPCRKEEECHRTPSAFLAQPDHAWFCGEACLHD